MTDYKPMPRRINWALLIELLRGTYSHGDGGLPEDSGIDPGVITDGMRNGVHSWQNGVTLWNLAVERLDSSQLQRCVI